MAPPTQQIDPHMAVAYDECDVYEWIAKHKGAIIAQSEANQNIARLLTHYPGAVRALDPELVARYKTAGAIAIRLKQMTNPLEAAAARLVERLGQRYGNQEAAAMVDKWLDTVAPIGATSGASAKLGDDQAPVVATKGFDLKGSIEGRYGPGDLTL